ncbi:MAG: nicotinate (nicotinamide) nucleotide adenylyltransferase [Bacteroidota bacterium]|jgi:nicotinate-nucleotide adenylyltransferase
MKTGLFFGSFNPVHVGHMVIAQYMAEFTDLDHVWLVVSPQNPLKPSASLLQDYHRFEMVRIAVGDYPKLKASKIEFGLPRPSYTVDTLAYLREEYPERKFVPIMGTDNLENLHKWKNWETILEEHEVYVYPRPNHNGGNLSNHPKVKLVSGTPLMEISASFIRGAIALKKDIRYMLPLEVYRYLDEMNFYR